MRGPDADARTGAIEAHLPLVRSIARRYAGRGEPLDDLVQAGTVGLIKAVDTLGPRPRPRPRRARPPGDRGRDPPPPARRRIADRTSRAATASSAPACARCATDLTARLRRAPTTAELADAAGVDAPSRRARAGRRRGAPSRSATTTPRACPAARAGTEAAEARVLLEAGWDVLDERERRLLELRYREDRSQSEIARELGLSQAHVSRLLKAALERLRAAVAPEDARRRRRAGRARAATAADERCGRLLLRLPRTLHTELADAAEREGVPLNTYISAALAAHVADPREAWPPPPPPPARPQRARHRRGGGVGLVLLPDGPAVDRARRADPRGGGCPHPGRSPGESPMCARARAPRC